MIFIENRTLTIINLQIKKQVNLISKKDLEWENEFYKTIYNTSIPFIFTKKTIYYLILLKKKSSLFRWGKVWTKKIMILFETKNNFTLRKDFLFLKKKNHLTFIIISKKKKLCNLMDGEF